jgi:ribonuclease HI
MDSLICEGRAGAGLFSDTLDIRKSYALGSLATVFQTEVYKILACSDYYRSANMHNMTICICSDSKAALLALSSYTISSKLLHQCWLSLQDLSNNNRVRLFWVPGCIKGNEEADRLARMGSDSHFCEPEHCVPLSASIVRDMNRKWVVLDAHSKNWIALNSCRQSKPWIKHPKLETTKYLLSLVFWFLLSRDIVALIYISTG